MNELIKQKTMSIKEISDILKIDYSHVYRNAKKLFPSSLFKNGNKTYLTEEQVILLSEHIKVKVKDKPLQNAKQNEKALTKEDLKEFTKDIVKECLSEMVKQIIPLIQNNQKQIEYKQEKITHYTISGYARKIGVNISSKEINKMAHVAMTMSGEMGYDFKQIDDSMYGFKNIYHEDVLKLLFDGREKEMKNLWDYR
jgi:hypothetical protein